MRKITACQVAPKDIVCMTYERDGDVKIGLTADKRRRVK